MLSNSLKEAILLRIDYDVCLGDQHPEEIPFLEKRIKDIEGELAQILASSQEDRETGYAKSMEKRKVRAIKAEAVPQENAELLEKAIAWNAPEKLAKYRLSLIDYLTIHNHRKELDKPAPTLEEWFDSLVQSVKNKVESLKKRVQEANEQIALRKELLALVEESLNGV